MSLMKLETWVQSFLNRQKTLKEYKLRQNTLFSQQQPEKWRPEWGKILSISIHQIMQKFRLTKVVHFSTLFTNTLVGIQTWRSYSTKTLWRLATVVAEIFAKISRATISIFSLVSEQITWYTRGKSANLQQEPGIVQEQRSVLWIGNVSAPTSYTKLLFWLKVQTSTFMWDRLSMPFRHD